MEFRISSIPVGGGFLPCVICKVESLISIEIVQWGVTSRPDVINEIHFCLRHGEDLLSKTSNKMTEIKSNVEILL